MLILAPFFLYMGLIVSFLMAIFPTTLAFTNVFSSDIYIVAIYSIGMGVAEIIGKPFLSFRLQSGRKRVTRLIAHKDRLSARIALHCFFKQLR